MRTRLWYAFLTLLLALPIVVFGLLLVSTSQRIMAGISNDYIGVVILSILLVILGPLLLGPARYYCIGSWTGRVPAEVLTGRGLGWFWRWFSFARLVMAGLFGLLALALLVQGQLLAAGAATLAALGFAAESLDRWRSPSPLEVLKSFRRPSRAALLYCTAGLWLLGGLVFFATVLDGVATGDTDQIAGGTLISAVCTVIGLAFVLLARRA